MSSVRLGGAALSGDLTRHRWCVRILLVIEPTLVALPTEDQLRSVLSGALREIYTRDAHLFTTQAGERAVVHKLAARLTPAVESWDGGWTVDAEYNRMSPMPAYPEAAYKYLVDVLGDEVRPAYPDLIVHRPGVDGRDGGNLLVVEAKLAPTAQDRERDHAKLVAWCRELGYVQGVRLELTVSEPVWAWVNAGADQRHVVHATQAFGK